MACTLIWWMHLRCKVLFDVYVQFGNLSLFKISQSNSGMDGIWKHVV